MNKLGFDYSKGYTTIIQSKSNHYRVKYSPNTKLILDHFNHKKTIALPSHPSSKIIKFDIDKLYGSTCESRRCFVQGILNTLFKGDMGNIICEFNSNYTKAHCYIELDVFVTKAWYIEVIDRIKYFFDTDIEIKNRGDENLRLPYSERYPNIGIFKNNKWNVMNESGNNFDTVLQLFLNNLKPVSMDKSLLPFNNNFDTVTLKHNKYKESFIKNNKFNISDAYADLKIGKGNRVNSTYKLACIMYSRGFNFKEYYKEVNKRDTGSKDLRTNNKEKLLKSTWENAIEFIDNSSKTTNSNNKKGYIQQSFKFSKEEESTLLAYLKRGIRVIGLASYNKNIEKIANSCLIALQEIHGRSLYNQENNIKYASKSHNHLNGSVACGNELFEAMCKELNLGNSRKIRKILESLKLIELKKDKEGNSYSYKGISYTKHYTPSKVPSYTKLMKRLDCHSKSLSSKTSIYADNFISSGIVKDSEMRVLRIEYYKNLYDIE